MENLIIPNWHPLLVHFTVALITVSTVFFILSKTLKTKGATYETVAKWTLWVGAGITVFTIIAGIDAYNTVAHDDVAHKVMKVHRLWAFISAGAILLFAIWTYRAKTVTTLTLAVSLVVAGLVGATGYLGSELVYRHGLGVMRLPDTSGEGHAHEGGDAHSHGEEATADHTEKSAPAQADHDHAEGGGHDHGDTAPSSDAVIADPEEVAAALGKALKSGDAEAVGNLLDDNVLIVEGGHAQTSKAEYMSGHMISDMAFLPNITTEVLSRDSGRAGTIA